MSMQMARRFRGRGLWQLQPMKLTAAILELIMLAVVPYASGQAPMPSVMQHAAKDCGSVASCPVSLPAGSVQDNMIVAFARLGGPLPLAPITDDASNPYNLAVQCAQPGDPHVSYIFYASHAKPARTVTLAGTASRSARLAILEAANTGNLDQFSCRSGSGSAADSGSILTTAGNELIVGLASSDGSSTATAGTGFTLLDSAGKVFSEYQLQPLAGAVDARMSLSPAPVWWAGAVASFKPKLPAAFQVHIAGLGTASFPIANASQVPECTSADGTCSIVVQICDNATPQNCLTSNSGSVSLLKKKSLPVPETATVPIASVSPN